MLAGNRVKVEWVAKKIKNNSPKRREREETQEEEERDGDGQKRGRES